jgi:hypothetical protein
VKGRDHVEELSVDGRMILEWILKEKGRRLWTGIMWLRIGTSGCTCEYGFHKTTTYYKLPCYVIS